MKHDSQLKKEEVIKPGPDLTLNWILDWTLEWASYTP